MAAAYLLVFLTPLKPPKPLFTNHHADPLRETPASSHHVLALSDIHAIPLVAGLAKKALEDLKLINVSSSTHSAESRPNVIPNPPPRVDGVYLYHSSEEQVSAPASYPTHPILRTTQKYQTQMKIWHDLNGSVWDGTSLHRSCRPKQRQVVLLLLLHLQP
jgi:hypothetical protein